MLDVKLIVADPDGIKTALRKRHPKDPEWQDLQIDLIVLMYNEIKLTRQVIENAKHLRRQLEKDLQQAKRIWNEHHPEDPLDW
jgi:seryl-tRNA synthetase